MLREVCQNQISLISNLQQKQNLAPPKGQNNLAEQRPVGKESWPESESERVRVTLQLTVSQSVSWCQAPSGAQPLYNLGIEEKGGRRGHVTPRHARSLVRERWKHGFTGLKESPKDFQWHR
jgi:hypothetical protein